MGSRINRLIRWLTLLASGAVVLQAPGCDATMQGLQTALLGAMTGMLYYLAKHV